MREQKSDFSCSKVINWVHFKSKPVSTSMGSLTVSCNLTLLKAQTKRNMGRRTRRKSTLRRKDFRVTNGNRKAIIENWSLYIKHWKVLSRLTKTSLAIFSVLSYNCCCCYFLLSRFIDKLTLVFRVIFLLSSFFSLPNIWLTDSKLYRMWSSNKQNLLDPFFYRNLNTMTSGIITIVFTLRLVSKRELCSDYR